MKKIIECIPNFSEGRQVKVIKSIGDCFCGLDIKLLHSTSDADHNRSVFTIVGEPYVVADAMIKAVGVATKLIDMNAHDGVHPCIGATDVVPFVPINGMMMDEAVEIANFVASKCHEKFGVPSILYESAATRKEFVNLANVRVGGFFGLEERVKNYCKKKSVCNRMLLKEEINYDFSTGNEYSFLWDEERCMSLFDYGKMPHKTAGAMAVGARKFLVAFNINLDTRDESIAKLIARSIRERDGGLPCVKALGLVITQLNCVQISMNLTDIEVTTPYDAFCEIKKLATAFGVSIRNSELIGMIPESASTGLERDEVKLSCDLSNRIIKSFYF